MAKSFPNTGATTGLAADRTAMTGMYAGQQFYETDTNKLMVYNGSSWVTAMDAQTAGGDLQGTYPNPTFKSGAAGDPIIWRPFNTSHNTEVSYSGAYNSSFTVTSNVPTNARYILADVFVTANISDHVNFELGNAALANAQSWVNSRGQQPSTQFGNIARNSVIVTYNGESDGYTPNYGMWYSSLTIPSSGRTIYMNNFGQSGSVGWVYLRVKAYSL